MSIPKSSKQEARIELKWNENISEFSGSVTEGEDFKIKGIAINAVTTSNGHKFLAEELSASAETLKGAPLLKDHENLVENIVGRVTKSFFDPLGNNIKFEAVIMDPLMKQMIQDGRLNSVSVGASVRDMEEENGELIPRGITFKELSLVAIPADAGANFNIALMEAYKVHSYSNLLKGGDNMADADQKPEEVKTEETEVKAPEEESKAETEAESKEESKEEAKEEAKEENVEQKETVALLKELMAKVSALETKQVKESEETSSEAEAEESEDEAEEVEEGMKFVKSFGSLKGGSITVDRKLR